jgi:hypothetical protein
MMRSRVTLAMIEAAAIDRHFASPLTIERAGTQSLGVLLPSTRTSLGFTDSWATASAIAHIVACRMLSRSMRATSAIPTPTSATFVIRLKRKARPSSSITLLSSMLAGILSGVENDGGGHHRSGPRPAPGFIDASNGPAAELALGGFQFECRLDARIGNPHEARMLPFAAKSKQRQLSSAANRALEQVAAQTFTFAVEP